MTRLLVVCSRNRWRGPTVPDEHPFMDPELVRLLEAKVAPFLR